MPADGSAAFWLSLVYMIFLIVAIAICFPAYKEFKAAMMESGGMGAMLP